MTRKPRLPTNPRTKAYQERVQRLATAIFLASKVRASGAGDIAADIGRATAIIDPDAPRDVVTKALTAVAREAEELIARNEEENGECRAVLAALELVQPPRPKLRVVKVGQG